MDRRYTYMCVCFDLITFLEQTDLLNGKSGRSDDDTLLRGTGKSICISHGPNWQGCFRATMIILCLGAFQPFLHSPCLIKHPILLERVITSKS